MNRILIMAILLTIISGCAATGVVQTGPESYMATANSTPFTMDTNGGGATINAIKLGTKQCNTNGKQFILKNSSINKIGAGAQANINFICVDSNDRDYTRPNITPVNQSPAIVINNN
ncbi:hypothetical protein [Acinetobacter calcoaceticus]